MALVAAVLILSMGCAIAAYDRPMKEVQASEIVGKIKNNKSVEYDRIIVKGPLDLKNLITKSHIEITNSRFESYIDLRSSTLSNFVIFRGSTFGANVYFNSSNFNGAVADFRGSTFIRNANFAHSTFEGYAAFQGSTFAGDADFSESTFNDYAVFSDSKFSRTADFILSKFIKHAYFVNSTFNESVCLDDCQFEDDALFNGAKILGCLRLQRTDYDKLYIRWNNIKELSYEDTAYLRLIENFKKLGIYPDADQCYVSYRNENRQTLPLYYRPIDWLLWILYGYGTMPELPFIWSVLVILLSGGFFYFTADIETPDKKTTLMEAMYLSAAAFTSGARTLGGFVSTPEDVLVKGRARYVLAAEKLLGLLLVGLFLTALARTVIR
ncbi:MAG: hypothetical protein A4E45_01686 [Methanosaeta sp. PtaB.Bin039]|nr:MAG: hypothetical protein A4E45_01686 [Methanosaeta sp. PtaB.Bin039]